VSKAAALLRIGSHDIAARRSPCGQPISPWIFADRLDSDWSGSAARKALENDGLALPDLAPRAAMMLEVGR
jgi:hypothetical protein